MKIAMHPVRAYTLFESVRGFAMSLTATVYVPFLLTLGFSYAQVAKLNAFFWGMIVLAELPTGMLADGRSRLWSIRTGMICASVSALTYAFVWEFWGALLAEVLMGIAFAFLSGAQQAWIVDALDHLGEGSRRREVMARTTWMRGGSVVLGGLAGALIGAWNSRAAWMAEALAMFLAFGITLVCMRDQGEPVERVSEIEALKKSVKLLRGHQGLIWAVLAALVFGCVLPFNHYWTPFFRERVGQVNLGWLWALMYLALASAGFLVRSGRVMFYGANGVSLALFLAGVTLAAMGLSQGILIPVILLLVHEVARGLYEPTLDLFIHDHVESAYRATYASLQSFLGKMSYGCILLLVWFFTRHQASTPELIVRVWSISGGVLACAGILLWILRPRS